MLIIKELSLDSKIGEIIFWKNFRNETLIGKLKEFDNGTAIVLLPSGKEKAVAC